MQAAHPVLIARTAGLAIVLVLAILVSSAYLRLTAANAPCAADTACETAVQSTTASLTSGRRFARIAHRLSASTVAVLALLITFITWTGRDHVSQRNRALSIAMLALILFLAVLGAVTRSSYTPAVTLGNVLAGNALAGILWWIWLHTRKRRTTPLADNARLVLPVVALFLAMFHICVVALGAGESLPLPVSLGYNLVATVLLLASLWWLSRSLFPSD